jgi:death-on-curing protein
MKQPLWVLPETVIAIHQMLLAEHGGTSGIRDQALLESALNRPRLHFEYTEDVSIFDLAAAYCFGLAKNHPFVDGNKRIALTISVMFLEINGYSFQASESDAVIIIEALATGNLPEVELSDWFKKFTFLSA